MKKKNSNLMSYDTAHNLFDYLFRGLSAKEVEENRVMPKGNRDTNIVNHVASASNDSKWISWTGIPFVATDKYGGNGKIAICNRNDLHDFVDTRLWNSIEDVIKHSDGKQRKEYYYKKALYQEHADQELCSLNAPDQYVIITVKQFRDFITELARYISGEKYYEIGYEEALSIIERSHWMTWQLYNAIGDHFLKGTWCFTRNEAGRTVLA